MGYRYWWSLRGHQAKWSASPTDSWHITIIIIIIALDSFISLSIVYLFFAGTANTTQKANTDASTPVYAI